MTNATPQQKFKAGLAALKIPFHSIDCFGSQVIVTVQGQESADRWVRILQKLCRSVRTGEHFEYTPTRERIAYRLVGGTV